MNPAMKSPLRREDERLLTGRARYVDNVHLDRMVHGVFFRCPWHMLRSSRSMSIRRASFRRTVRTYRAQIFHSTTSRGSPLLASSIRDGMPKFLPLDRVRFVGEPVAFLVASDRYGAEISPPWCISIISLFPFSPRSRMRLLRTRHSSIPARTRNIAAKFEHAAG